MDSIPNQLIGPAEVHHWARDIGFATGIVSLTPAWPPHLRAAVDAAHILLPFSFFGPLMWHAFPGTSI